jgi:hypothetical protein
MEKMEQVNETLWTQIMDDMRTHGQAGGYASDFVSKLRLVGDTGTNLVIEYPADLPIIWIEINYRDSIADAAMCVLDRKSNV